MEEWDRGEPCAQGGIAFCARCKPHPYGQTVYISPGGSAFHKARGCELLIDGQRAVERRGGAAGEVRSVAVQEALGAGRFPCQQCYPVAGVPAPAPPRRPRGRPSPSARRVRPAWIMERWMDRWGQLSEDEQARFLAREEIDEIAAHTRQHIRDAISLHRKLSDIAGALGEAGDSVTS